MLPVLEAHEVRSGSVQSSHTKPKSVILKDYATKKYVGFSMVNEDIERTIPQPGHVPGYAGSALPSVPQQILIALNVNAI